MASAARVTAGPRSAAERETGDALRALEAVATGYVEAADGDSGRALRWALQDLAEAEQELGATKDLLRAAYRLISRGYVRGEEARA